VGSLKWGGNKNAAFSKESIKRAQKGIERGKWFGGGNGHKGHSLKIRGNTEKRKTTKPCKKKKVRGKDCCKLWPLHESILIGREVNKKG